MVNFRGNMAEKRKERFSLFLIFTLSCVIIKFQKSTGGRMLTLLIKWFIRDSSNTTDPKVRTAYGVLAGAVGIGLNLLLFVGKLLAGTLTGSIAISADAFNNLSDVGSSLLMLLGFTLARQKPDPEHPFGHGRMEYIAGLFVAVAILLMGFELIKNSVEKVLHPEPVAMSFLSAAILVIAILVKLYMFVYNWRLAARIESSAMSAIALDSLNDAVATTVVLLSMGIVHFMELALDGWCGILVACFVLFSGFKAMRGTIAPLLGQPPDPALIRRIESIVLSDPNVLGMHDMIVHDYGPGRRMVSLHAEVPANGDILVMHDMIDNIEKQLRDTLLCPAVIHMDPVVTDDKLTDETYARVAEVVKGLDERATIHDFRMVMGPTHTNVIFDVVVPYDVPLSENQIKQRVAHMVHALDANYFATVDVDRSIR